MDVKQRNDSFATISTIHLALEPGLLNALYWYFATIQMMEWEKNHIIFQSMSEVAEKNPSQ